MGAPIPRAARRRKPAHVAASSVHNRPAMTDHATIAEASRLTGVSERRLRRWVAAGHLPDDAGPRGRLVGLAAVRELAGLTGAPDDGRSDSVGGGQATGDDRRPSGDGHDPTGAAADD